MGYGCGEDEVIHQIRQMNNAWNETNEAQLEFMKLLTSTHLPRVRLLNPNLSAEEEKEQLEKQLDLLMADSIQTINNSGDSPSSNNTKKTTSTIADKKHQQQQPQQQHNNTSIAKAKATVTSSPKTKSNTAKVLPLTTPPLSLDDEEDEEDGSSVGRSVKAALSKDPLTQKPRGTKID
jgi:hypothetical protein